MLLFAGCGVAAAQAHPCGADAATPISTDRPQVTEASTVVPCGSLQLENGLAVSSAAGEHDVDLSETWVRVGLTGRGEFRVAVPEYFSDNGGFSGASDMVLGYKQQLGPVKGVDFSLIPSLSVPVGTRGITSGGYDPSLQAPWSRALSKNWTAAGMLAFYDPTQPNGRNPTGQGTVYLDRQITGPLDAWMEYAGTFPSRGGPQHVLNVGTSFKLTPQQQIDFHVAFGLSAAAADYSVGVGYSVRFQFVKAKKG